jgi:hypothetical protein
MGEPKDQTRQTDNMAPGPRISHGTDPSIPVGHTFPDPKAPKQNTHEFFSFFYQYLKNEPHQNFFLTSDTFKSRQSD